MNPNCASGCTVIYIFTDICICAWWILSLWLKIISVFYKKGCSPVLRNCYEFKVISLTMINEGRGEVNFRNPNLGNNYKPLSSIKNDFITDYSIYQQNKKAVISVLFYENNITERLKLSQYLISSKQSSWF